MRNLFNLVICFVLLRGLLVLVGLKISVVADVEVHIIMHCF